MSGRWLAAAVALVGSSAHAQELSLFVGGVHARYAEALSGTAGLASARLSAFGPRAAGTIEAGAAQFLTGEWVTQLGAHGAGIAPLGGGAALGIEVTGFGHDYRGGTWSGLVAGGPIFSFSRHPVTVTVGASVGGVRQIDAASFATRAASARVRYLSLAGVMLEAALVATAGDTLEYADATVGVAWRRSRLSAGVSAGLRAGDLTDGPFGSIRLGYTTTPWSAVELTAGRYAPDLSGFNAGAYVNAGVRLRLAGDGVRRGVGGPAVTHTRAGSGRVRVSVEFPRRGVRTLEIAGDWNGWTPVPLARAGGGRWTVELPLRPGVYKYQVIVNRKQWTVPDGASTVPDEFGGRVGLLIIRGR